jgi:hypothetical protein
MWRLSLLLFLFPAVAACGVESARAPVASNSLKQMGMPVQSFHNVNEVQPPGANSKDKGADTKATTQPTAGRQVIYRAAVNLSVKSFAETDRRIGALVNESGGYVSQFSEDRSYGTQRGGRWTIRVPVAKFTWLLDQVGQLGVAERRDVQSQDVSEEYVDLESRLKNKQTLESRLLELVAKRGDEIKDVLALESELSRVREEIEKIQGRLRYLTDRVALTTIEISAYERLDYEPPEATFGQRITSTFTGSLDHLRQFGQAVVLVLTALAPWVVAAAILGLPVVLAIRWRRRARSTAVTASMA